MKNKLYIFISILISILILTPIPIFVSCTGLNKLTESIIKEGKKSEEAKEYSNVSRSVPISR